MQALILIGVILALLAALIHVMIFVLESLVWSRPATWRRFGLGSQADADVVRPMAFNQGFYNLFLAIGVVVGVVLRTASGIPQAGLAVMFFGLGSMVLAATVLITSNPKLARSAAVQGVIPTIAVVLLAVGSAA